MNNTQNELGLNRTGISTSPHLAKAMVEGTSEFAPASAGDEADIAVTRSDFVREAEPLGSVPPPPTVRGMAQSAAQALLGRSPLQLIDKLGERLAFERTGVRLYEAVLSKFDALGSFPGGPTRVELEEILFEEYAHMQMLTEAIVALGADPTVMTPSADLQATMSKGVLEVVVDPRTNLAQTLEAALLAELTDNDSWSMLTELARGAGLDELAKSCAGALTAEQTHLGRMRRYLAAAQRRA